MGAWPQRPAGTTADVNSSGPRPTRADHQRFVADEGWQRVASTHHETFELLLPDGRVFRTRISRPPNRTTYGPRRWSHLLRDQLGATADEFRACVRDGVVPDPTPDDAAEEIDEAIPVDVVSLLIGRVGLSRGDLIGMTRDEAISRLNEYWATGR